MLRPRALGRRHPAERGIAGAQDVHVDSVVARPAPPRLWWEPGTCSPHDTSSIAPTRRSRFPSPHADCIQLKRAPRLGVAARTSVPPFGRTEEDGLAVTADLLELTLRIEEP